MQGVRLLIGLLFITPVLFMISGAFRPDEETFRYSATLSLYTFIPSQPSLDAFSLLSQRPHFGRHLVNTVVMGVVLATATTLVVALAAYPLARMRFRGRSALFFGMVTTVFIPLDVIIVPLFFIIRDMNLLNTFWGLLLPWVFSPLHVYLARQAMQEIPPDLEEAALVDGASFIQILVYVILPNLMPTLITIWLLNFISVWDWFLWPLVAMQDMTQQMVQVGIANLFDPLVRTNYSLVFAGALVAVAPVFIIFFALQRYFLQTVAHSGSK
jgi:ABC-type glycerol-3-phosphate transport system permease component